MSRHELDGFAANIAALEAADGARTTTLHVQVAAGVPAAKARAALLALLHDVRDDAKLSFGGDLALQHAFGVGADVSGSSSGAVRHLAEEVLAAAAAHTKEASAIGLDTKGVHHLADLVHALPRHEVVPRKHAAAPAPPP